MTQPNYARTSPNAVPFCTGQVGDASPPWTNSLRVAAFARGVRAERPARTILRQTTRLGSFGSAPFGTDLPTSQLLGCMLRMAREDDSSRLRAGTGLLSPPRRLVDVDLVKRSSGWIRRELTTGTANAFGSGRALGHIFAPNVGVPPPCDLIDKASLRCSYSYPCAHSAVWIAIGASMDGSSTCTRSVPGFPLLAGRIWTSYDHVFEPFARRWLTYVASHPRWA